MNLLLESDLEQLLEERPGPCFSFYLPLSGPGTQPQQGAIRLKNLLGQAEADLRASELTDVAIKALLGPLKDLVPDLAFWNTREAGAALFRAPGFSSSLCCLSWPTTKPSTCWPSGNRVDVRTARGAHLRRAQPGGQVKRRGG